MSTALRRLRWTTITLVLASVASPPAWAQDPPHTLSAPVLRALAVAADGYRTGLPVWFVMDMRPPEHVVGVYQSLDGARHAVARDSTHLEVFGPFVTERDARQLTRVVGITLVVSDSAGGRSTIEVDPDSIDALFLTPGAVERFLLPYYVWAYGSHVYLPQPGLPLCHARGTFFCEVSLQRGVHVIGPLFR